MEAARRGAGPGSGAAGTTRLVAWAEPDGRGTWGVADPWDRVWDGGRASGALQAEAQRALCDAASTSAFLQAIGAPAPGARGADGALMWSDLSAGGRRLKMPWLASEVWAAGVTYRVSEGARMRESADADVYARVYGARRPELFFKGSGDRARGPGEPVGLRPDSRWQVPEPEVALVIGGEGRIAGYTAANDMSCRDVEGENPLYLPQAKVYDGSCALGPAVRLADGGGRAHVMGIAMRIERDGEEAFSGRADTGQMTRTFAELLGWLGRAYTLAPGTVLLTGTCIVPGDAFSLRDGDLVRIFVDGVGELVNVCATLEDRWPVG